MGFILTHLAGFGAGGAGFDGNDSFTKLLLHMDGADASTTFTDSSSGNKTGTVTGNAQIDTAQSKFGGAAGLFDGAGDYVSFADHVDFEFGTESFTIDFWIRPADTAAGLRAVLIKREGALTAPFAVYQDGTTLRAYASSAGASFDILNAVSMGTVAAGTWSHHAYVRNGNDFMLFKDGTQVGATVTSSSTIWDNTEALRVGSDGSFHYNGHLDELRISKGAARWTANFTPPGAPYS